MEHTADSYEHIVAHKELSYLCIIIVLILHALLLLLFFTFTHLLKPPPPPPFETIFDVSGPPGPTNMPQTPAGAEEETAAEGLATPAQESTEATSAESASPDGSPSMSLPITDGLPIPDIIEQVTQTEQPTTAIPPMIVPARPHAPGQPRPYRIRRPQYNGNATINGATFSQMGQQIQSTIAQTVETAAKEQKTNKLKYQSYVNSLHHFLYGNFNPRNEAIYLEYSVYMPIDVDIEIDEKGRCATVTVSNSTGDPELDAFIIHHLKKAGPFPPLPAHFGVTSWHFPLRLMVNCPRGKGVPKITPH